LEILNFQSAIFNFPASRELHAAPVEPLDRRRFSLPPESATLESVPGR
jgi:hypothetical protein